MTVENAPAYHIFFPVFTLSLKVTSVQVFPV